jgi:hypothetical protein
MAPKDRRELQKKVQALVDAEGLLKIAGRIEVSPATLRRFLGGQPAHPGTLLQIQLRVG